VELLTERARRADHLEPGVGKLGADARECVDEHVDPFDRVQLAEVHDGRRHRPRYIDQGGKLERGRQMVQTRRVGALRQVFLPLDLRQVEAFGRLAHGPPPPERQERALCAGATAFLRRRQRSQRLQQIRNAGSIRGSRREYARRRVDVEEENRVELVQVLSQPVPHPPRQRHVRSRQALRHVREADHLRALRFARRPRGDPRVEIENVRCRDRDFVAGFECASDGGHSDGNRAAECSSGREPGDTHEQPHSE